MKKVYLDGAANTPLDPKVHKAMKPYLKKNFVGNSFAIHEDGIKTRQAIEEAREKIAYITGTKPEKVFFTSGATESNNWVIKATCLKELMKPAEDRRMIILCSSVEHSSVYNACHQMELLGFTVIEFYPYFIKKTLKLLKEYGKNTCLFCCMAVNNETGEDFTECIQAATKETKKQGITSLIDCTQFVSMGGSFTNLSYSFSHADFYSFSAHKFYGPTGVGALIQNSASTAELIPLLSGGAQEEGLRGGTSNTAGIVGMAKALSLTKDERNLDSHFRYLYESLETSLAYFNMDNREFYSTFIVNNDHNHQYNIVNIGYYDPDNEKHGMSLADALIAEGIECSAGSACDSQSEGTQDAKPSRVLLNSGVDAKLVPLTVRISFTKHTTRMDLTALCKALEKILRKPKKWEEKK